MLSALRRGALAASAAALALSGGAFLVPGPARATTYGSASRTCCARSTSTTPGG
ncbi:hypothetical protein [Microbispora sp. GKU 823]|uniref:hypothetical protein n=1 Tax=Microbispora sp. GKU 823 TaxID=1652100 RepID=UPI0021199999|nr:hypothetical protein [Microbispora sp. GKU 823]